MSDQYDTVEPGAVHTVTFQPGGLVVAGVPTGETLLRAAARANIFLSSPCAGAGSCGKCLVRIESGLVRADPTAKIEPSDWERGMRLACVTRVIGDVVVSIPEAVSPGLVHRPRSQALPVPAMRARYLEVGERGAQSWAREPDPPVRRLLLTLNPPSTADRQSDLARLRRSAAEELEGAEPLVPLTVARSLPRVLREAGWRVSALVRALGQGWEVVRVEHAAGGGPSYVAVVDLGTTTVWGQLLDAGSGRVRATAAAFNGQIQFGDDVISRMVRAQEPGGKERLQAAAAETIADVLGDLTRMAEVDKSAIAHVVVAGNSAMTCLLLGVETHYLRLEPYVPPFDNLAFTPAAALGLGEVLAAEAAVQVLPLVGSYVGGDIVAGILASGIAESDRICLYLDAGTNGEVVIGNREWLLATSCSAGPAFEGGGLRHGMRAITGAIESVAIDVETLESAVLTIDDGPPLGICGSGVIDAVAQMLKTGILLPNGRFDPGSEAPGLREREGRREFVLVAEEFSGTGADIVLTEADIDNVIRAKAAMFAGVSTLLRSVSLEWTDLERIVVAGAFGRHLRVAEAMTIGLFPELDPDGFEFLGNGSLVGAGMVALSRSAATMAEKIAALMNNIELSDNPQFQEEYVAAMFLPHTDTGRFPSLESLLSERLGRRA